MAVNISATFSKDERPFNGLEAIATQLVDERLLHAQYTVVATIRPKKVATDAEDGSKTPTIRFDHIEVVVGDHEQTVKGILAERYQDRTGKTIDGDPTLFDVAGDGGDREVPEASAEELLAEHRERRAAREAEAGQVPAATFQDGGTDG